MHGIPEQGFDRRADKYQLTIRIGLQDHVAAEIGYESVEALTFLLASTRPHDIRHIATDENDAQRATDLLEGRRHTFEPMPRVVGKAQAKATSRLLVRFDRLAKGLEKRPSIFRVQQIEGPALFQGLLENFAERAGAERGAARVHKEQTPPVVEFENQIRRIRGERSAAGLGIAQCSGLLGDLLPKPAEFVDELRPVFLLVAAQRVPSRWETSQSAPT
jgi:hypothetical protein